MISKLYNMLDSRAILEKIGDYLDDKVSTFTIQPGVSADGSSADDYLKRWYLCRLLPKTEDRWPRLAKAIGFLKKKLGIELYLHKVSADDGDRHLHDHPWPFIAIILVGGYEEIVPKPGTDGAAPRDRVLSRHFAPTVHCKTEHDLHQLRLFRDQNGEKIVNWSIVIRGPKVKDWGFSTEDGWKDHSAYLDGLYGQGQWEREPHYYDEIAKGE